MNRKNQSRARIIFNPSKNTALIARENKIVAINHVTSSSVTRIEDLTFKYQTHLLWGDIYIHADKVKF